MKDNYEIAIIEGDGIGPELCQATKEVIKASGVDITWLHAPLGKQAVKELGNPFPSSSVKTIKKAKYALKAPLVAEKNSGGISLEDENGSRQYPSINNALRRELSTYANIRPVNGYKNVSGKYENLDLIIIRETSEGIYSGIESNPAPGVGHTVNVTTQSATERIANFAFQFARRFNRNKVSAVHKANVLHKTDGLFLSISQDIAASYSDLKFDDYMIDAACYHVIKTPQIFDVVLMPNQYGDIFSDVVAGLAGSMGLAPGANIGPEVEFFEASHGAAPDIAGRGIVNPISLILSGAMLLDSLKLSTEAFNIRKAVQRALLDSKHHTPDLGGKASTQKLTDAICEILINDLCNHTLI